MTNSQREDHWEGPSEPTLEDHANWHGKILIARTIGSVIGGILGVIAAILCVIRGELEWELFSFPVGAAVLGGMICLSMGCLVAPGWFLTGPKGKIWMKRIGAKSVTTARIACLFGVLVLSVVFVVLGYFFLYEKLLNNK